MNPTNNFDVIIIGAGPSGIFCAYELIQKKPDMKILMVEKGRPIEKRVQRILGYVEAELTHGGGGFYCGQDADSDGVEGRYYVFTPEEIKQVLGPDRGDAFCSQTYG